MLSHGNMLTRNISINSTLAHKIQRVIRDKSLALCGHNYMKKKTVIHLFYHIHGTSSSPCHSPKGVRPDRRFEKKRWRWSGARAEGTRDEKIRSRHYQLAIASSDSIMTERTGGCAHAFDASAPVHFAPAKWTMSDATRLRVHVASYENLRRMSLALV